MKILFSPSEAKKPDGDYRPISKDSFFLPKLFDHRKYVTDRYLSFLKNGSVYDLSKLFGIKKESDILKYKDIDIYKAPTLKAIDRYTGIAYDYLGYDTMEKEDREFLDDNMIIFSNLFGPLLAKDKIPFYKLKQGERIDGFVIERYYGEHFAKALDDYLQNEFVVDLRAGFYLKFYDIKKPYVTMKFIKNTKVVSHWAKAYRGKVAGTLAKYKPRNEDEFSKIAFDGLSVAEIRKCKHKTEYIYEIEQK